MRWWVPQRQRLPDNAALMSASEALGFCFKNATLVITMPLVQ
jgi:hypothetical protein